MTPAKLARQYKPYLKSAAQQLREAANALDRGHLGSAESYMGNAVTTLQWVEDDAQGESTKKKR